MHSSSGQSTLSRLNVVGHEKIQSKKKHPSHKCKKKLQFEIEEKKKRATNK